ncbi:peptide ABC transporter substrate-binding protein [Brachyspira hyodysenteriae]|uniref:peptide ABC transporter substrate-binding protein n=1 Tax=Brachyspira hyodysenteriae TaxID=159 RepID=UPI0022CD7A7C|nr:peptide ABC transporter substrate-binding protein [Brachyspira hyodysenteriae]MCZ9955556.1 peptide ABC transporter substrate-binding protein [Brachyspira hyodysenteriae]
MFKKYYIFIIILMSVTISCTKIEETINHSAPSGKYFSLLINIGQEPYTMDPSKNVTGDSLIYLNHIFEGLVSKDKDGKIIPAAAQSWNISSDGLVYTFDLRQDAYWSDGNPVLAKDFVYSFRRLFDPNTKSKFAYQYNFINNSKNILNGEMETKYLGVEAIDEYTLEIVLDMPLTYFLEILSYPTFYPLREDIINLYKDNWTENPNTFIGNGPFKVVDRKIGEVIIMEKNEFYWNNKEVIPSRLEFILKNDPQYSLNSMKNGLLHFSRNFPIEHIISLQRAGYIHSVPRISTYFYFLNTTNKALSDINVRKALSLAIDRNYIVENITKNGERPAAAFVPYGIPGFFGDFRENGGDYIDIDQKNYENNIKEAKRLMILAGYPNGNGFPVMTLKTTYGVHKNIFEAIQKMWKENLGIEVNIEELELSDLFNQRFDKNFEIASGGWNGDFNDPINFLSVFLSTSPNNNSLYSNKRYDDLIKTATLITDLSHRMMTMHKAEELLINDMAIIPIYFSTEPILVSPKLKGVLYDSMGQHSFVKAYLED